MILRDLVLSGRLPRLQDISYVTGGIVYRWADGPSLAGGHLRRPGASPSSTGNCGATNRSRMRSGDLRQEPRATRRGVPGRDAAYLTTRSLKTTPPSVQGAVPRPERRSSPPTRPTTPAAATWSMPRGANGFITIDESQPRGGGAEAIDHRGTQRRLRESACLRFAHRRIPRRSAAAAAPGTRTGTRSSCAIGPSGRWSGWYQFESLVSILSPVWGLDSTSVIFSGLAERRVGSLPVRLSSGEFGAPDRRHLPGSRPERQSRWKPPGLRLGPHRRRAGGRDQPVRQWISRRGRSASSLSGPGPTRRPLDRA